MYFGFTTKMEELVRELGEGNLYFRIVNRVSEGRLFKRTDDKRGVSFLADRMTLTNVIPADDQQDGDSGTFGRISKLVANGERAGLVMSSIDDSDFHL